MLNVVWTNDIDNLRTRGDWSKQQACRNDAESRIEAPKAEMYARVSLWHVFLWHFSRFDLRTLSTIFSTQNLLPNFLRVK
jgi:hypothetical protein